MGPDVATAVSAVGTLLGGVAAVGSMTKKTPAPTPLPKPAEPTVMPTPDDEMAQKARKRQLQSIQQRSGYASTILSDSRKDTIG